MPPGIVSRTAHLVTLQVGSLGENGVQGSAAGHLPEIQQPLGRTSTDIASLGVGSPSGEIAY